MLTEQDLINDKWKLLPSGYTKLGVIVSQKGGIWQCRFIVGDAYAYTDPQPYYSLVELYSHIKSCVKDILDPYFDLVKLLTIRQKRTLKNWIL